MHNLLMCRFASRLVDLKECSKFMESGVDIQCNNLHDFVKFIKKEYGMKYAVILKFLTLSSKYKFIINQMNANCEPLYGTDTCTFGMHWLDIGEGFFHHLRR